MRCLALLLLDMPIKQREKPSGQKRSGLSELRMSGTSQPEFSVFPGSGETV